MYCSHIVFRCHTQLCKGREIPSYIWVHGISTKTSLSYMYRCWRQPRTQGGFRGEELGKATKRRIQQYIYRHKQTIKCIEMIVRGPAPVEFWKGGFQYAIKARVGRLLGRLGACPPPPPPGKFWISDLLRSFLVYSWGEISKVGRPTAKPGCCVWSPQN